MTKQQNQTENMETTSKTQTETCTGTSEETSRTAMVSAGDATLETVISILKKNKISYKELGKDQKDRSVLQLSYTADQQPVVDDVQLIVNFVEDAIELFTPITANFLKAYGQEIGQAFKQLQAKYSGKKLVSVEK